MQGYVCEDYSFIYINEYIFFIYKTHGYETGEHGYTP